MQRLVQDKNETKCITMKCIYFTSGSCQYSLNFMDVPNFRVSFSFENYVVYMRAHLAELYLRSTDLM